MPKNLKLQFGNPEHIDLARNGAMCECGHSGDYHGHYFPYDCQGEDFEDEVCSCEAFTPKTL